MTITIRAEEDTVDRNGASRSESATGRFVPGKGGSRYVVRDKAVNYTMTHFEGIEGVHIIRRGENVAALEAVKRAFAITDSELAHVLGVSERTLDRRRQQGRMEPKETDRVATLFSVLDDATALFEGDLEQARRWLKAPVRGLAHQAPLDLLDTEAGARMVHDLIGRLEHGVFS